MIFLIMRNIFVLIDVLTAFQSDDFFEDQLCLIFQVVDLCLYKTHGKYLPAANGL